MPFKKNSLSCLSKIASTALITSLWPPFFSLGVFFCSNCKCSLQFEPDGRFVSPCVVLVKQSSRSEFASFFRLLWSLAIFLFGLHIKPVIVVSYSKYSTIICNSFSVPKNGRYNLCCRFFFNGFLASAKTRVLKSLILVWMPDQNDESRSRPSGTFRSSPNALQVLQALQVFDYHYFFITPPDCP